MRPQMMRLRGVLGVARGYPVELIFLSLLCLTLPHAVLLGADIHDRPGNGHYGARLIGVPIVERFVHPVPESCRAHHERSRLVRILGIAGRREAGGGIGFGGLLASPSPRLRLNRKMTFFVRAGVLHAVGDKLIPGTEVNRDGIGVFFDLCTGAVRAVNPAGLIPQREGFPVPGESDAAEFFAEKRMLDELRHGAEAEHAHIATRPPLEHPIALRAWAIGRLVFSISPKPLPRQADILHREERALSAKLSPMATRIGILGLGTMGRLLAQGIRDAEGFAIIGSGRSDRSETGRELGIAVAESNGALVNACDVVVLCVKPYQARDVLIEIRDRLHERHTLVSICASVTLDDLRHATGGRAGAVVRAMPNTPCLVGAGMTVFAASGAAASKLEAVQALFAPLGRTAIVDESLMDGVTALSGCGPAYGYLIIEALGDAGVKCGLPRATATLLAAQTLLGAAKMVLERDVHPASLRDEVMTPAGCTIDGLLALEDGKLRSVLMSAVLAAAARSKELRSTPADE